MFIVSVMPSSHLILCRPLLLLPSIFHSIRVFSNESFLHLMWPKYWSFSFSTSPLNEYSGLISFRMNWLDLLAIQGTLKSFLQHHGSKASILQCSALFMVQLSSMHDYWKTIALTRSLSAKWCLCFLIHCLGLWQLSFQGASVLISWLQSLWWFWSPRKYICHYFQFLPFYLPWSDEPDTMILVFLTVEF